MWECLFQRILVKCQLLFQKMHRSVTGNQFVSERWLTEILLTSISGFRKCPLGTVFQPFRGQLSQLSLDMAGLYRTLLIKFWSCESYRCSLSYSFSYLVHGEGKEPPQNSFCELCLWTAGYPDDREPSQIQSSSLLYK